jgi:predicted nucleic acid-binding protein
VRFLLDTNVISEWTKPKPDPGVVHWLDDADEDRIFISAITIAEIRYGIERMPAGRRRDLLAAWLADDLPMRFEDRVLPVDAHVGDRWARFMQRGRAVGRPVGIMDAFIAATAEYHDLHLVTRNAADFETLGLHTINPWHDQPDK